MDPFPQVFGQVKEWLMLELHQIIRASHVVACQIVFILFYNRGSQGGVFKVMKNIVLVFLAVWVFLPTLLGKLRSDFYYNCIRKKEYDIWLACCMVFILLCRWGQQVEVLKLVKDDLFFRISSHFWPFLKVFYQEWFILELHEMMRVPHAVACPVDFNLLCDRDQQGSSFSRLSLFFLQFLGRLSSGIYWNHMKW